MASVSAAWPRRQTLYVLTGACIGSTANLPELDVPIANGWQPRSATVIYDHLPAGMLGT